MKRYIRKPYGRIIDTTKYTKIGENDGVIALRRNDISNSISYIQIKGMKTADTIEELIEVGDLVRVDYYIEYVCREYEPYHINRIEQIEYIDEENNLCSGDELDAISEYDITELYTKQGNNYILVARKENGEWRVI